MQLEHAAIWCADLEAMRDFYCRWLGAQSNAKYRNARGFESYFLRFERGARLELMHWAAVNEGHQDPDRQWLGLAHLAFTVGSREVVDQLTAALVADGVICVSGPRQTGDGYYESVVLDPEGNQLELCACAD